MHCIYNNYNYVSPLGEESLTNSSLPKNCILQGDLNFLQGA